MVRRLTRAPYPPHFNVGQAQTIGDDAPRRRKPVQWERRLQEAIVDFHATCLVSPLDAILFAIPNGEKRDKVTAGILTGKRRQRADLSAITPEWMDEEAMDAEMMRPAGLGVLPGASDLGLILPAAEIVWLETKIPKTDLHAKGKQTNEQKAFERSVRRLGHDYRILYEVEDYQSLLVEKGVRLRVRQLFPVAIQIPRAPAGLKIPTGRSRRK